MFTGIIEHLGQISQVSSSHSGKRFKIEVQNLVHQLKLGDSLSVNGVCLTCTEFNSEKTTVDLDVVHITLEKTNLGKLRSGDVVNLEASLGFGAPVGGHLVQGHVNGVAKLQKIDRRGENRELWFRLPEDLIKYAVLEGSIAIDGISLTIAKIEASRSEIMISVIPHTWENTNLHHKEIGASVNIEVDYMAKYVEKYVKTYLSQGNQNEQNLSGRP